MTYLDEWTPTEIELLGAPITLVEFISQRIEDGWVLGDENGLRLPGAFVWLVWAFEAGLFINFAAKGGHKAASVPFCEACQRWMIEVPDILVIPSLSEDFTPPVTRYGVVKFNEQPLRKNVVLNASELKELLRVDTTALVTGV